MPSEPFLTAQKTLNPALHRGRSLANTEHDEQDSVGLIPADPESSFSKGRGRNTQTDRGPQAEVNDCLTPRPEQLGGAVSVHMPTRGPQFQGRGDCHAEF